MIQLHIQKERSNMNKVGHRVLGVTGLISIPFITNFLVEKSSNEFFQTLNNNILEVMSFTTPFDSILFLIAFYIGITLPDIDLLFKNMFGDPDGKKRYLYHRQITHSIVLWIALFYISITQHDFVWSIGLLGLSLGVFTHLIGDMVTGSVPLFLHADYRKQKGILKKILNLRIGVKLG